MIDCKTHNEFGVYDMQVNRVTRMDYIPQMIALNISPRPLSKSKQTKTASTAHRFSEHMLHILHGH